MASKKSEREAREARDRLRAYTARQEVHERQTRRRVRDNILAVGGVAVVAAVAGLTQFLYFSTGPGAPAPEPSASIGENIGVPDMDYAEYRSWTGELVLGDIELGIELDGAAAPQAVSAFLFDVENGFYPGKTCHRLAVAADYQFLQCGSLDGVGGIDPDFSYGPIENAPEDDFYPAGTIVVTRFGADAYSQSHQFSIVTDASVLPPDSAGGYTVIGRVTSGLDRLVDEIVAQGIDPGTTDADGSGAPAVPVAIADVALE